MGRGAVEHDHGAATQLEPPIKSRANELVGLGYIGVDIVLDRVRGPLVLELNARPGLNIQLANRVGLLTRLARIEAEPELPRSVEAKIELARELFADSSMSELQPQISPQLD